MRSAIFDLATAAAFVGLFAAGACAWRCAGAPTKALATNQPLLVAVDAGPTP